MLYPNRYHTFALNQTTMKTQQPSKKQTAQEQQKKAIVSILEKIANDYPREIQVKTSPNPSVGYRIF